MITSLYSGYSSQFIVKTYIFINNVIKNSSLLIKDIND